MAAAHSSSCCVGENLCCTSQQLINASYDYVCNICAQVMLGLWVGRQTQKGQNVQNDIYQWGGASSTGVRLPAVQLPAHLASKPSTSYAFAANADSSAHMHFEECEPAQTDGHSVLQFTRQVRRCAEDTTISRCFVAW